jgi:anti-sigma B factor antagonist
MHLELKPVSDDCVHVSIEGEVDLENSDDLREALILASAQASRIELHTAALTFIDSAGLSALIAGHRALVSRYGAAATIVVVDPPQHLQRLLQVVGLTDLFPSVTAQDCPALEV